MLVTDGGRKLGREGRKEGDRGKHVWWTAAGRGEIVKREPANRSTHGFVGGSRNEDDSRTKITDPFLLCGAARYQIERTVCARRTIPHSSACCVLAASCCCCSCSVG